VREVVEMLRSKKMRYVIPEIAWAGISLAIITAVIVPIVSTSVGGDDLNEKLIKSMFAMVCLGIGEIVGSLIIGQVIDRKGNKPTSIITLILIAL
jgi:MFS family permease